MIFYENCLLAENCHEIFIPYFFRKLGKMSQNLSSAAVVIGTLRINGLLCMRAAGDDSIWIGKPELSLVL